VSGVTISRAAIEAMEAAVARDRAVEHCGLLLGKGKGERIATATTARNVAAEPARRFEIDPAALFAALRAERAGGPAIVGYWHSHPLGGAEPSPCDAAMAEPDGRVWIILASGEARAWRAVPGGDRYGRFEAVTLRIEA
jgi:proteasome lid subunit RPN8/RPN11